MKIRTWNKNDYISVLSIAKQFNESTPNQDVFNELVWNKGIFVAEEQWNIIGFISYKLLWNDTVVLQFLRVDQAHHRKGIASLLIKHIQSIATEKWYYALMSTILEDNIPSKQLHEKLWFVEDGYIGFKSGKEKIFLKYI